MSTHYPDTPRGRDAARLNILYNCSTNSENEEFLLQQITNRDADLREYRELLTELLAHAKDAPPELLKRVAELLAKVEGSGS